MENFSITMQNVTNPPEKVLLMYQAVSELLRDQKDIAKIKVADITSRAGIGKGTAYEYFSSKEELIANALLHEYSQKVINLIQKVQEEKTFEGRYYRILDWIRDNKGYHQMFSDLIRAAFGGRQVCGFLHDALQEDFETEVENYIGNIMDLLMEEGYKEGVFTEVSKQKRRMAFLSTISEYAMTIMEPSPHPLFTMDDQEVRRFVYESMVKALN